MNKLLYSFKYGFKNITSYKGMSAVSVFIIAAALSLAGIFAAVGINVNAIMDRVGRSYEINVYISKDSKLDFKEIETELTEINNVKSVNFVSKSERLAKASAEFYGDDTEMFSEEENPLRNSFLVTVEDLGLLEQTKKELSAVEGIEEVICSSEVTAGITRLAEMFKGIWVRIMAVLVILALFIVYNTIRLKMSLFSDEIKIMRIIGASGGHIAGPYVVQGFILGIVGALVACIFVFIGYGAAEMSIASVGYAAILETVGIFDIMISVAPKLLAFGAVIGTVGSIPAVMRRK